MLLAGTCVIAGPAVAGLPNRWIRLTYHHTKISPCTCVAAVVQVEKFPDAPPVNALVQVSAPQLLN